MTTAKDLFLELVERPVEERAERLAQLDAADPALGQRVRSLLEAHAEADRAFEGSGQDLGLASAPPPGPADLVAGQDIGPFRLLEPLGEGGFAFVWLAQQETPVRRRVAVKVLKPGLDTREVLARFQVERQALAVMDHPGIARVLDGGQTPAGRSWFAMEWVDGQPITRHCDGRQAVLEERLRLFVEVCRAVQHAHQKGVIHRDLKPNNVLVAELDGGFVPKVIDFGIAKATQGVGGEGALSTTLVGGGLTTGGQLIGTPAYMSPEQISGSADIDTRTDVYALGVLLYELLSGELPFEDSDLRGQGLFEIQRLVRDVDPPRPSERIARNGPIEGGPTAREVRGELDWIVMCCLEKDRDRRYVSTMQLAQDVQRYLDGLAILAGPPSALYRARKFARRHRAALASLAAMFLLLAAGIVSSTSQARRAMRAEALARQETERARVELERYEVTSRFLEDVLLSIDPAVAQDKDNELLLGVLDRAAAQVEETSTNPQVEARLRHTLGYVYYALRADEASEEQLRKALALREEEHGRNDPWTLEVAADLGGLLLRARRLDEAGPLLERVYEQRVALYGPRAESTLTSLSSLAILRRLQDDLDAAERLGRELERVRIEVHGELHEDSITAMNNLAHTLEKRGRLLEAQERYEKALARNEELLGPKHPHTLAALNNLASAYQNGARYEEALDLLWTSLQRKQELYEEDHPSVLLALNNIAQLMKALGQNADAEAIYREALDKSLARFGPADRTTHVLKLNLATLLMPTQREEALEMLEGLELYLGSETMGSDLGIAIEHALQQARR